MGGFLPHSPGCCSRRVWEVRWSGTVAAAHRLNAYKLDSGVCEKIQHSAVKFCPPRLLDVWSSLHLPSSLGRCQSLGRSFPMFPIPLESFSGSCWRPESCSSACTWPTCAQNHPWSCRENPYRKQTKGWRRGNRKLELDLNIGETKWQAAPSDGHARRKLGDTRGPAPGTSPRPENEKTSASLRSSALSV